MAPAAACRERADWLTILTGAGSASRHSIWTQLTSHHCALCDSLVSSQPFFTLLLPPHPPFTKYIIIFHLQVPKLGQKKSIALGSVCKWFCFDYLIQIPMYFCCKYDQLLLEHIVIFLNTKQKRYGVKNTFTISSWGIFFLTCIISPMYTTAFFYIAFRLC